MRPRLIPTLLLKNHGLVKGVNFKNHRYVGDPINAVHIFNSKEVDELAFLDITATREGRKPDIEYIGKIADECYMPFAYGGGIKTVEEIRSILYEGAEKVIINTSAIENPEIIKEASDIFGSQSIVVSLDVKKTWRGYSLVTHSGFKKSKINPIEFAIKAQDLGAGEILVTSIDMEGTSSGYDLDLITKISEHLTIPVIASGGAGSIEDLSNAIHAGADAVSAGSLFVFHGRRKAVLITYPIEEELLEFENFRD